MNDEEDPRSLVTTLSKLFTPQENRVLRYLAEKSQPSLPEERTQTKLCIHCGVSEKTVEKVVGNIRDKLKTYYRGSGKIDNVQLCVADGTPANKRDSKNYLVSVELAPLAATRRFWAPHLASREPVQIIAGAPLFFRHAAGHMRLRDLGITSPEHLDVSATVKDLRQDYTPCYHYVSMGAFRAATALTRFFERLNVRTDSHIVLPERDAESIYHQDRIPLRPANLILFDNARCSWLVEIVQKECALRFTTRRKRPSAGEDLEESDPYCRKAEPHRAVGAESSILRRSAAR